MQWTDKMNHTIIVNHVGDYLFTIRPNDLGFDGISPLTINVFDSKSLPTSAQQSPQKSNGLVLTCSTTHLSSLLRATAWIKPFSTVSTLHPSLIWDTLKSSTLILRLFERDSPIKGLLNSASVQSRACLSILVFPGGPRYGLYSLHKFQESRLKKVTKKVGYHDKIC